MVTKKNTPHNKGKIKDIKKLCNCKEFEIRADKKINICINSRHTVSLIARKFFNLNQRNQIYYKRKTKKIRCLNCREFEEVTLKSLGWYCSNKCQADYQNKKYVENLDNNKGLQNKSKRTSQHFYTYLKKKNKHFLEDLRITPCCKVPIHNEWIGYKSFMELNHINHNHQDNSMDNLELICSNCHSGRTLSAVAMRKLGLIGRGNY